MLAPELMVLEFPDETLADCSNCVMVERPNALDPGSKRYFREDIRCCSYHPRLPNFLVGKALLEGGDGRRQMEARIRLRSGVTAMGVKAPEAWQKDYDSRKHEFGREIKLRCPYWVGGEFACSIWKSRNSVCRTWHCKHVDGHNGLRLWEGTKMLLAEIENRLALHCCKRGKVPKGKLPVEAWLAWFEWCARKVGTMTPQEIERERGDKIDPLRGQLRSYHSGLERPIPNVLGAAVQHFERLDGATRLVGYSFRDDLIGGPDVFALLSKLDGKRPWREALAEAEAELGAPIGEEVVRNLWRMGMLKPHDATEQWRPHKPVTGVPETG